MKDILIYATNFGVVLFSTVLTSLIVCSCGFKNKESTMVAYTLIPAVLVVAIKAILDSIDVDNFRMLEITPQKKCDLGPYTWGAPNSRTYKYCSSQTPETLSNYICPESGYIGRPVHYVYTPESDSTWGNPRDCNTLSYDRDPYVL